MKNEYFPEQDPAQSYNVHLVKDQRVHSSLYELIVKISDKQGRFVLQNLSVAACDCAVSPNCLLQRNTQKKVGNGVLGTSIFAALMIFAFLLLALTCSCGSVKSMTQVDNVLEDALLSSNIEKPGTDCMVPTTLLKKTSVSQSKDSTLVNNWTEKKAGVQRVSSKSVASQNLPVQMENWSNERSQYYSNEQTLMWKQFQYQSDNQYQGSTFSRRNSQRRQKSFIIRRSTLQSLLTQRLHLMQSLENEMLDYKPQLYAFEDNTENFADLDPIDLPSNEFDPEQFSNLGPAFKHLASICNPESKMMKK